MAKTMMALYGVGLFVLGAAAALGGERFILGRHDQRDDMTTVAKLQDWQLTCQPRTTKKGACFIQSGIVQKQTNSVIAELSVAQKDNGDELTVVAPLGVFVPAGATVVVGGISKSLAFKTCLPPPQGCIASLAMDQTLSDAMSHGQGGTLTLVGADGKSVPISFSLHGYDDAMADRTVDMAARK